MKAPTMKIFILFEGFQESFDVTPDQTVMALKKTIKDRFPVRRHSDKLQTRRYQMSFAGATLKDSWALGDIGITAGSVIHCLLKIDQQPVLYVFNGVTGHTLLITGTETLLQTSVANLKNLVSEMSGLPVSTFRLSRPSAVILYECNLLQDYHLTVGSTVCLNTWDGWAPFLQGCLWGHRLTVQSHLSEEMQVKRFQLQVALYIAARSGHMDLACYLLEKGVRTDKPVGVHPYRQWCRQTDHQNTGKCPIHAAAETNQLLILKLFINKNILSLGCRDNCGRDPLRIAVQYGHRECVRYLADKLCSVVSLVNTSMSVRIYLQVKRWVKLGKRKAAHSQCCYTSTAIKAKLGTNLLVDGFNHTKMSSELRRNEKELKTRVAAEALKIITPINEILSLSNPPYESSTSLLTRRHAAKSEKRRQRPFGRRRDDGVMEKERVNQCKDRFILPLINTVKVPRQTLAGPSSGTLNIVKYSSDSSHQTSRSKAVYFFTLASTFTKKPWMKQLKIAQTLLRRHNCLCHSQN